MRKLSHSQIQARLLDILRDVIRSADWVIDLGPDAGTPEKMIEEGKTFTAKYLGR